MGIRTLLRNAVVALALLSFTACTTLRPIDDFSPSRIQKRVAPGDRVHIVAVNGKTYELTVTDVEADSLEGESASGKRYKVEYEAILAIEVEEKDAFTTAVVTLGTVVAAIGALMVYLVVRWVDD